jgi:transcription factor C subunit 6
VGRLTGSIRLGKPSCILTQNIDANNMTRQLRLRKARTSYTELAGFVDEPSDAENHAGPSALFEAAVDDENGLEPVPGDEDDVEDEDQDAQYDMEEADTIEPEEVNGKPSAKVVHRPAASASTSTKSRTKRPTATKDKGKGKAAKAENAEGTTTVSRARRPKGKMYALPTPSVQHRHRAVPLYSREGRTERLTVRPSLFEPSSLTLTTSFTERPKVSERVNKAWGFNVGYGPLWDLAEDRGWYKEAITTGNNTDTEAKRRPRVYPDLRVPDGWEIMSLEYVFFSFAKFRSLIQL